MSTATSTPPAKKITHVEIALRDRADNFSDRNSVRGLLITPPQSAGGEAAPAPHASGPIGSFEVLPGHQPLTAFLPPGTTAAFGPFVATSNGGDPPDMQKLAEVVKQGCLLSVRTDNTVTTVTIIPFGE